MRSAKSRSAYVEMMITVAETSGFSRELAGEDEAALGAELDVDEHDVRLQLARARQRLRHCVEATPTTSIPSPSSSIDTTRRNSGLSSTMRHRRRTDGTVSE